MNGISVSTYALLGALLLLPQAACDTPAPEPSDVETGEGGDLIAALLNRDRSFAESTARQGMALAAASFIADDAVLFRPGPVEASVWMSEGHPEPANLQWVPTAAALASSGDLGYTTGPVINTDDQGRETHGTYLTIWQMNDDGYRVVLDAATPGPNAGALPEPADGVGTFEVVGTVPGVEADLERDSVALEDLKETDRGYAVAQATNGTAAAMMTHAANAVRIHRSGRLPILGTADDGATTGLGDERPSTSPVDGRVSRSGTLGYVYGSVAVGGNGDGGNYIRIWRRDPGAAWTLAVEVIDVAPE